MNALTSRGGGRLLLLLVLAGFVGFALQGSRSVADESASPGVPETHGALVDALAGAVPVASMATDTSKTYRRPDGTFVTRVFAQAADADAAISATGGGFVAEGHGATTHFPASLDDAVKVTRGDAWVSTQLVGAGGVGRSSGTSVIYADALPGVGVTYRASDGAIGEDLHLGGPGAPSRYVFEVSASDGVRAARQPNGTIALTEADGHSVINLAASYAYADRDRQDTEPVDTDLAAVDGGWRVTLSVDSEWLDRALADGPVTIDPTVYLNGASQDCGLSSDTPSISYCSNNQLWVGYNGDHDHHTLVKWDLSAIPNDAVALWGDASLFQDGTGPAAAKSLTVHRLTQAWTNGASWNTYDGTHSWSTPGGDFDPAPAASAQVPAHHTGWTDWFITPLVQHWIDGSQPNYGLAVQDQPGPQVVGEDDFFSTEGTDPDQAPELDIAWAPRTGSLDAYTLETQSLDAKTTAGINVANGNLLVSTNDINSPGAGLDLRFDHYYNSLLDGDDSAALGVRMTASLGRDLRLRLYYGDIVSFERGDGVRMPFIDPVTSGSTTTWTTSYELAGAALSRNNTTNTYTLRLPAGLPSQPGRDLTLTFDSTGKLTALADQAGHAIRQSYYSGGDSDWPTVNGITDTNNAAWTVSRGSLDEERIADILSPDNHHTTFGYQSTGRYLNQVTEADGSINRYGYDGSHRVTSITTPDGNVTKITYTGSSTRIASLIRTTDTAHTTGPTTSITYNAPTAPCQANSFDSTKNVVTRPDGTSTTYCANDHAQVTYDTDNPTTATPSGDWYDLHDQYTQGTGTHTITIAGTDAGSGVKKLSLERGNGTVIASTTLPCDPRNAQNPTACSHSATSSTTFDPSAIPEGVQTFRVSTTDYAGNIITSPNWNISIDRTGPTAPDGLAATYELDTTRTLVTWNPSRDPDLPDGENGAGVASYNYRYQVGSGPWSAWLNITAPWFGLTGATAGQVINVQVQAVDAVGNAGAVGSGSATNEVSTLTPDDVGQTDTGESGEAPLDPEPSDLPTDPAPAPSFSAQTASAYTEVLCSAGSNPCGTYDGEAAAAYAIKWNLDGIAADDLARRRHNFNYRYFGGSGGDCTNFASQVIKAGGMKYMRAHGHNSPDASTIGTDDFLYGEGSWWSWFTTSTDPDPVTPKEYGSTESFARAPKLFHHLIDYGLAEIVPHNGHIRAGDLVFYNLTGTAIDGGTGNELDHTQIVSAVTSKSVWVVQHSPGYRHTLRYVLDKRIGGHPGVDFQYWIVHPKYTAANITP